MGFLLGTGAGQISRYLNRSAGVTITNYLRIARALGYRCRIVLEKADASQPGHQPLSDLRIEPHKVSNARPASAPKDPVSLRLGKKLFPCDPLLKRPRIHLYPGIVALSTPGRAFVGSLRGNQPLVALRSGPESQCMKGFRLEYS